MERRVETAGGRGRMVSSGSVPIRGNGNLRGALDDFDRSVSTEPWNGCECVVGARIAEDGDVYKRCEREKYGIRGDERERRRFGGADAGALVCGGVEIPDGRGEPGGDGVVEGQGGYYDGGAQGRFGDVGGYE